LPHAPGLSRKQPSGRTRSFVGVANGAIIGVAALSREIEFFDMLVSIGLTSAKEARDLISNPTFDSAGAPVDLEGSMRTGALPPERCHATAARPQGGHLVFCMLLMTVAAFAPKIAIADEGGASFWLPGTFGSFAAVPAEPGWSTETVYYHSSTTA